MDEAFVGCCLSCGKPYRVICVPGHAEAEYCLSCHRHPECCRCGPAYRLISIAAGDTFSAELSGNPEFLIPDRVGAHVLPDPVAS